MYPPKVIIDPALSRGVEDECPSIQDSMVIFRDLRSFGGWYISILLVYPFNGKSIV